VILQRPNSVNRSSRHVRWVSVVATAALTAAMLAGANAAYADTPVSSNLRSPAEAQPLIDPVTVETAYQELTASDFPRTTSVEAGVQVQTFTLPNGVKFSFSQRSNSLDSRTVHPNLGGGWDSHGLYVSFNRVDQAAIAGGGAAAIAAAICVIPGIGWASCAVAAGLVTAAAIYIGAYGMCPTRASILRVHVTQMGYSTCNRS